MRMSKKAFTLVELLVVIAIIATLVTILIPGVSKARETAKRTRCANSVGGIGKGMSIYATNNQDQSPYIAQPVTDGSNEYPTGKQYHNAPAAPNNTGTTATGSGSGNTQGYGTGTNYNVSAHLFLLVRDGQQPDLFICPSTSDTVDPNIKGTGYGPNAEGSGIANQYNWDFTPFCYNASHECISFSFQAPLNNGTTGGASGASYQCGVTANSDPKLAIMADRTPLYLNTGGNYTWVADYNWGNLNDSTYAGKDPHTRTSQNHAGEVINVLYAGLNVMQPVRPNCGVSSDSIYVCVTAAAQGAVQTPTDQGSTAGGANGGSVLSTTGVAAILPNHVSAMDSYLIGPCKWTTAGP